MFCLKIAAIILLGTLSKGELPEDDFRIINKKDLLSSDSDSFSDNSTNTFSQLLFDVARDQVIVGARDALYRLSLRGLRVLEHADWPAPADKAKLCQDKGQTEVDCHNYVKVLLAHGHRLFACGTNAFSPVCSWREIESISTVTEWSTSEASCPYNPHSNVTALLSSSGQFYTGTSTDFSSSKTAILRSRGAAVENSAILSTNQYDLNWLNEPHFVGSFEDDQFVYFVFREVAVEYMNCGKTINSRIARVCKNDGGSHGAMLDEWSSFLKASLSCTIDNGDVPFHYHHVQSIEYLHDERTLVAVFTTAQNALPGSAVCIYKMSDIQASFDGPYKVQESSGVWNSHTPNTQSRDHFKCDGSMQQRGYYRYHLMYNPVKPLSGLPVYKIDSKRLTHVTVDVATTNIGKQLVVFAASQDGDVLKLSVLPTYDQACLVEVWRLGDINIQRLQFVKDTMSVYIGSVGSVIRLGASRCSRSIGATSCIRRADPHCGWHAARELCMAAREPGLMQDTARCITERTTVDGGWGSWSDWAPCMQDGTEHTNFGDDNPDMCMCRSRSCDNPKPANSGQPCQGASISVSNCTVHGGWAAWGAWGACSGTCGIAVKSRRRACSAPPPAHGGRLCVGLDTQDLYCTNLPPCPDPALAPVDGGWSSWAPWSTCSSPVPGACGPGAGARERRRSCNNPLPKHGGSPCEGSKVERQICDLRPCEVRKATAWTPWVHIPGNASDGSYSEKRFKFLCKAPTPDQIRLSIAREEDRYCSSDGVCSNSPPDATSVAKLRHEPCNSPDCAGGGTWSCWSEWSSCVGSCNNQASTGRRTRSRVCLSPAGCNDAALERRVCMPHCAETASGWGEWGSWSACENDVRVRRRSCDSGACVGPQLQAANCNNEDDIDNELYAMPAYSGNVEMASFVTMSDDKNMGVGGIIGCAVAAFAMGCLVCLAGVIFMQRRGSRLPWLRKTRVPSSPHYITAKQNSYVTVPLKDVPRKAKRQPSFTGIGGTSGIIVKSNNISNANNHNNCSTTPKLYPKAIANEYDHMGTLKRHSNQPNNKNNLDIEEEKFY